MKLKHVPDFFVQVLFNSEQLNVSHDLLETFPVQSRGLPEQPEFGMQDARVQKSPCFPQIVGVMVHPFAVTLQTDLLTHGSVLVHKISFGVLAQPTPGVQTSSVQAIPSSHLFGVVPHFPVTLSQK